MKGLTLNGPLLASGLVAGALFGAVLVGAPEASAAPCTARSEAHIAEHGGVIADDAYHISRGELPNCRVDERSRREPKFSEDDSESKSRYCSRRWFC